MGALDSTGIIDGCRQLRVTHAKHRLALRHVSLQEELQVVTDDTLAHRIDVGQSITSSFEREESNQVDNLYTEFNTIQDARLQSKVLDIAIFRKQWFSFEFKTLSCFLLIIIIGNSVQHSTVTQLDIKEKLTDENLETSLTASSTCGRKAATSSNSRTLTERMVNNGNNLHRHYWTTLSGIVTSKKNFTQT